MIPFFMLGLDKYHEYLAELTKSVVDEEVDIIDLSINKEKK